MKVGGHDVISKPVIPQNPRTGLLVLMAGSMHGSDTL